MGITYIDGTARGPQGKEENVSFLVDSGATYSLLPAPVWESVGLVAPREQSFTLADGDYHPAEHLRVISSAVSRGDSHTGHSWRAGRRGAIGRCYVRRIGTSIQSVQPYPPPNADDAGLTVWRS